MKRQRLVYVLPWMSNRFGDPILSIRSFSDGTFDGVEWEENDSETFTIIAEGDRRSVHLALHAREQEILDEQKSTNQEFGE